jgi:hypothetical protein
MPSHSHHVAHHDLCICCHGAYAPAKSSLCERCESEIYPGVGATAAGQHPDDRRAGTDRRKRAVPVAVNLREIDRRGFLEIIAEEDLVDL